MRLSNIAIENLKRRKSRALFLIIALMIGIGTVVALYSLTTALKDEIGTQLDQYGANIVIVPRSSTLSLDYGGISVSGVSFDVQQLKDEDVERVKSIPYRARLSTVAPKLLGAVTVEGKDFLLVGVSFDQETRLKKWWQIVGSVPSQADGLLLGHTVAHALGVIEAVEQDVFRKVSQDHSNHQNQAENQDFKLVRNEITIAGQTHRISGVLRPTGGRDDQMIYAGLEKVQQLTQKPGQLSLIEVSALCKDCPIEDIVAQISSKLPHARVSAIQQAVRARAQTVERLTRFSIIISLVVLLIGSLMIFVTLMSSVIERTKEIGILRAVGFRKEHIIKILVFEAALLSLLGGTLGWLAGTGAGIITAPYFAETEINILPDWRLALASVAIAAGIGIISSIYPAIKAARLDPVESLRHI